MTSVIWCLGLRCSEKLERQVLPNDIFTSRSPEWCRLVIVYTGDETVAAQFPHGNASSSTKPYMRTQPHVLQAVRDNASTSSNNIYHTMITAAAQNTAPAPVTSAPRNVEQIRNTKKIQRNQARLSQRRALQLTRAGIRQQLHPPNCYIPWPLSHLLQSRSRRSLHQSAFFIRWPWQAYCHSNVRHYVQLGRFLRFGPSIQRNGVWSEPK